MADQRTKEEIAKDAEREARLDKIVDPLLAALEAITALATDIRKGRKSIVVIAEVYREQGVVFPRYRLAVVNTPGRATAPEQPPTVDGRPDSTGKRAAT